MKLPDILSQKEVCELIGLQRATLYYFIQHNGFPAPKKLGIRMARWSKKEVLEWCKKKGFDTENV